MRKFLSVVLGMALMAYGSVFLSSCGDDDDSTEEYTGESVASFNEEGNVLTLTIDTKGALLQTETATFNDNGHLESYICRYKYAKSAFADIAWEEFGNSDSDLQATRDGNTIIVDMTPNYDSEYFTKDVIRSYFQERVELTNKKK